MSLEAELAQRGLAGWIQTPVHDVYRKARMLSEGDPDVALGLGHLLPTTVGEVMEALGRLAGRPYPEEWAADARSWVSPQALASQALRAGERLRAACERGELVLFGTGHPGGPLGLYVRLAEAMRARGARIAGPCEQEPFGLRGWRGRASIRYVCGVACVYGGANLLHTHSAEPMEHVLDAAPRPDLVVGDHGFAGAGLARGAEAVAVLDTNDPALVLAWARGLPVYPLLCDDNQPPHCYEPLERLLLSRLS